MTESEQLQAILMAEGFWDRENCNRFSINAPGGMAVEVIGALGELRWKVTAPDRRETISPQQFSHWQDAKVDLRRFLTERLKTLADAATPPARQM